MGFASNGPAGSRPEADTRIPPTAPVVPRVRVGAAAGSSDVRRLRDLAGMAAGEQLLQPFATEFFPRCLWPACAPEFAHKNLSGAWIAFLISWPGWKRTRDVMLDKFRASRRQDIKRSGRSQRGFRGVALTMKEGIPRGA